MLRRNSDTQKLKGVAAVSTAGQSNQKQRISGNSPQHGPAESLPQVRGPIQSSRRGVQSPQAHNATPVNTYSTHVNSLSKTHEDRKTCRNTNCSCICRKQARRAHNPQDNERAHECRIKCRQQRCPLHVASKHVTCFSAIHKRHYSQLFAI